MKQVPVVDIDKCTRCNLCMKICPARAISVNLNSVCAKCIKYCIAMPVPCLPEYLDFVYDVCTSCGLCVESCARGALLWMDIDRAEAEKMMRI